MSATTTTPADPVTVLLTDANALEPLEQAYFTAQAALAAANAAVVSAQATASAAQADSTNAYAALKAGIAQVITDATAVDPNAAPPPAPVVPVAPSGS